MEKHIILFLNVILTLLLFTNRLVFATDSIAIKEPDSLKSIQSQFDFWVGEWNLTWGEDERGINIITKPLDSLVIMENFNGTPSSPLKGISVSVFNKRLGKWQQTWVDNQGSYLDFTGEFKDGKMILQRKAYLEGKEVLQRMVWYDIEPENLEWNWERSLDNGKTWEVLWNIHYSRR